MIFDGGLKIIEGVFVTFFSMPRKIWFDVGGIFFQSEVPRGMHILKRNSQKHMSPSGYVLHCLPSYRENKIASPEIWSLRIEMY